METGKRSWLFLNLSGKKLGYCSKLGRDIATSSSINYQLIGQLLEAAGTWLLAMTLNSIGHELINKYIHTYIHTQTHTYMHMYIRTYTHKQKNTHRYTNFKRSVSFLLLLVNVSKDVGTLSTAGISTKTFIDIDPVSQNSMVQIFSLKNHWFLV